jgi:hypothetical protein
MVDGLHILILNGAMKPLAIVLNIARRGVKEIVGLSNQCTM